MSSLPPPASASTAQERLWRGRAGRPTLFVYGTLRSPDVLSALLGRVPARRSASARGWRAAALPGCVYPGLVPARGIVRGELLSGLGPDEWNVLHIFEGPMYELRLIELTDGTHSPAYVLRSEAGVLEEDWSYERFRTEHLARYLEDCLGFGPGV